MTDETPARTLDDHEPPPEVPDFDLLRPIGEGGFGKVWLGRNRATGHLRAVKVIPLRRSGSIDAAGREISSIMRLEAKLREHPSLLAIHHVGKTASDLFYVMDLADDVSGVRASNDPNYRPASLESRLAAGALAADECARCARQLLEGLMSLHEAGMVHRDVKPANCLFVAGELKLADFGLLTEVSPLVSRAGTQKYMPPDGRMDARADVYAAGLVIYEMVTGLPVDSFPRLGPKADEVARSPEFCRLMNIALRACQPNPRDRYQDAQQMLAEITASVEEADARRPSRRLSLSLATIALTIVLSTLTWWWATRPSLVDVNFATYPFEATVYVDGALLVDGDGKPYTTPCTVDGLRAGTHRVTFKRDGLGDLDLGTVNFKVKRQVVGQWGVP